MLFTAFALAGCCLLVLVGCAPIQSLQIPADAALDGWIQSNGIAEANGSGPCVGDIDQYKPGVGHRQFYSFGLSSIPADARIVTATLSLYLATVKGDPLTNHGVVLVDHLDYGSSLDAADCNAAALNAAIGTITDEVKADVGAGRSRSQFRLRFSILDSDNDGVNDLLLFTDAEDSSSPGLNKPPSLTISWR